MRVAIVTPYCSEPVSVIQRCIDSVTGQTHPCTHILVADGRAHSVFHRWSVQHISLTHPHRDFGITPRLVGSISAYAQGFDALCWLDVDNWLEPEHIASLLDLAVRASAPVVTATRTLYRPDGTVLGVCAESDGVQFTDTNCYLLMREGMMAAHVWGVEQSGHECVADRRVWRYIRTQSLTTVHNPKPTVNYTTLYAHHISSATSSLRQVRRGLSVAQPTVRSGSSPSTGMSSMTSQSEALSIVPARNQVWRG